MISHCRKIQKIQSIIRVVRYICVPQNGKEVSTCYFALFDSSTYMSVFTVKFQWELVVCELGSYTVST